MNNNNNLSNLGENEKIKFTTLFALSFLLLGFFSALLTGDSSIYAELNKPPLSPPPILFSVVWSILYVIIGGVVGRVFSELYSVNENVKNGLTYAFLGFLFNLLWYPLFFGRGQLLASLIDLVVIFILNILCIVTFYKIKRIYGYLLIPYAVWLAFAFYLNLGFIIVN